VSSGEGAGTGFSQLAHDLIFQLLHRAWGTNVTRFFVFVVSGLIHRVVISLPAGGGYGLPTMYFMVQGAGVAVERSSLARRRRALPDPGRKLSSAIPLRLGERSAVAHAVQPKLLWVQSAFTVLTITAFGVLTLALHAGRKAARSSSDISC
jgi:hypothetical protein